MNGMSTRRLAVVTGVALLAAPMAGCALTSGIVPLGPNTYTVTELRAPAAGGLPEAQRVVFAEANGLCGQQGRVFIPVGMAPGGDPRTPYGPSEFTATFQCLLPDDPVVARFKAQVIDR